ncbi:hypothetical protein [Mycolicibacterium iranicum]|uniref:Uncharacterized protein n=1 Tax=Mycolicibacterium iranicum TaxID=912594 RepID=A0A178LR00_MYCIR|nr:hypothetical protein [Mycolicibacterium iranicum]OAN34301.1 hypothetical protein A4X20_27015 [Mycolicibacterium iranicum]
MASFPEETYLLDALLPPVELPALPDVLLKVDTMSHLEHDWDRLRRVRGQAPTSPGVYNFVHMQFVDPDVDDVALNLSHDVAATLVRPNSGNSVSYAPGVYVLAADLTISEIVRLNTAVFIPVDEVREYGITWRRSRLFSEFATHSEGGTDIFTIRFADPSVPAMVVEDPRAPIPVKMAAWPTGKYFS